MMASLRRRSSAMSVACASCVASMAFMRSALDIRDALSEGSGIGLSLTAVRDESIAGNEDAEARTMDWMASIESCDGGTEGAGAWKKSGCVLSAQLSGLRLVIKQTTTYRS